MRGDIRPISRVQAHRARCACQVHRVKICGLIRNNRLGSYAACPLEILCVHSYYWSMNKPLLSPINDYVFKRVFGEHLSVLADLLQAVLALPVTEHDIRVVNPTFAAHRKATS